MLTSLMISVRVCLSFRVSVYVCMCLFDCLWSCIVFVRVVYCTQRGQAFIFKHGQVAKRDYVREL